MGLAASVGKDNDELVDNLIEHESLKTGLVEKAMRLVDRGRFMPEDAQDNAYKDSAWKSETGDPGFLHISAPCIYASVLENLDLEEGMSFLNIGSGTGYLSTMVGFILGESGINHGIELYENIVNFATERVMEFLNSKETSAFEWCAPYYFIGNAFQIEAQIRYDRIYCGALVPEPHRAYFCSFLKIGGVLIMPYGHSLQRITRKTETMFNTRDISAVTFSHLIPVNPENLLTNYPVKLPLLRPISLQQICRKTIRKLIRQHVLKIQKVEMRNHIHAQTRNKKGDRNSGENASNKQREEEEDVTTDEPPTPPRRTRRPNLTLIPRRIMDHPVVLFEDREREDNEDRNETEEGAPAPNPQHRMMPVRQLFAMFARERLRRHHAARAIQAAEQQPPNIHQDDSDISDSSAEEEVEEINHPGPYRQPQQFYNGPDDNSFGFQFVAEEDIDVDDGINLNDLFDHFEGREESDAATNTNETAINREEIGNGGQINDELTKRNGKSEKIETNQNCNGEKNVDEGTNSDDSSASSIAALQNKDSPINKKPSENGCASQSIIKSGINKRPRQRSCTTSSSDNAPQASKIQRIKSTSDESTSDMKFNDEPVSDQKLKEGYDAVEIKAEQQNYQMHAFHMEFYKCIDNLPLTVQMRNYIKFGV